MKKEAIVQIQLVYTIQGGYKTVRQVIDAGKYKTVKDLIEMLVKCDPHDYLEIRAMVRREQP